MNTDELRKRSFSPRKAKGKTRPQHGSLEMESLYADDLGKPVIDDESDQSTMEEGSAGAPLSARGADAKLKDDDYGPPNLTQEQAIIAKDRCWLGWLSFWLLGTGVLFPCESWSSARLPSTHYATISSFSACCTFCFLFPSAPYTKTHRLQ